jgi:hypothetical protein
MGETKAQKSAHSHVLHYSLLVVAIALIGVACLWLCRKAGDSAQQAADVSAALVAQKAQTADREKALASLPNTVVTEVSASVGLIAFLGSENTQCYKAGNDKGYYKVVKEIAGKFAKMQYGCVAGEGGIPPGGHNYILAKKLEKWQTISPTNQWSAVDGENLPSCKMINDNKVSKLLEPKCYGQPDVHSGKPTVVLVTNP